MLHSFESPKKQNYFAPEWKFDFFETNIRDENLLEDLRKLILIKEKEIINQFPLVDHDGGTGLGLDSLTARFPYFNIFSWTEEPFVKLQTFIKQEYKNFLSKVEIDDQETYISCWANVMRSGQFIEPHWHSCFQDSYIGGHFIVSADNTATVYQNPFNMREIWPFGNIPGNLTFFPSHITHWTTQHLSQTERITIAFDIVTKNYIDAFPDESKRYIRFT